MIAALTRGLKKRYRVSAKDIKKLPKKENNKLSYYEYNQLLNLLKSR